jgi:hypothetical protein
MPFRTDRQVRAGKWVRDTFPHGQASNIPEQATRLLEEALECAQAAGVPACMANKLIYRVYGKEPGDLAKEIGQVGLCILTLSVAAGVSADNEEAAEVAHVIAQPASYYHERYARKVAGGFTIG